MSWYLAAGRENPQGDGEVEATTVFWQICRRKIQGDAFAGELEGSIEDGAAYAILALLDCGFRQTHQGQRGQAVGQVRLDGDGRCFYTDLGAAVNDGQGHDRSLIKWGAVPVGAAAVAKPVAAKAAPTT